MKKTTFRFSVIVAAAGSYAGGALALDYQVGGLALQLDNRLTAGAAWRVSSRDETNIGIANGGTAFSTNGDDGNLAFDKGDVTATTFKITSDLSVEKGNYGLFVRASYLYDPTLGDKHYFRRDDYGAGTEAPDSERRFKERQVRDHLGDDFDLLDASIYGSHSIGGRTFSWKLGRQLLNWGESTLVVNGINSIVAADASQLRVPGFELDEVVRPVNMVWASYDLPYGISVEGFYQLEWRRTQPDVAGSFRSTTDFVGIGGTRANIGFGRADENTPNTSVIRVKDREPDDSGQYGVSVRTFLSSLHDTDLAFYAANYHSRLPVFSGTSSVAPQQTAGSNYFIEYPEDIQIYGFSFNTAGPLGTAVQGEYSYKVDQPLQIDDVELLLTGLGLPSQINRQLGGASGQQYIRGWRRHDVSQLDLSMTRIFGPSTWLHSSQSILLVEWAGMMVHDLPGQEDLRYEGPATYTPGFDAATDGPFRAGLLASQNLPAQEKGYAEPYSWGYKVLMRFDYNNVLGRLQLQPVLRFEHDVNGISPAPVINFVEDRKLIGVALNWTFGQAWAGGVGYSNYFDGGKQNLLRDRDLVDMNVKFYF